jgi:hypothetical protein
VLLRPLANDVNISANERIHRIINKYVNVLGDRGDLLATVFEEVRVHHVPSLSSGWGWPRALGAAGFGGSNPPGRRQSRLRSSTMQMAQIFAGFGALEAHDRFHIGAIVREPFACLPVTAADFAAVPVPRSASTTATFLSHLQDALAPVLDSEMSSWTLGELVPAVATMADGVDSAPGMTNRLVALVRTNGYRTWRDLSGCAIGEIRRWYGAGQHMTNRLVIAAVATALRSAPMEPSSQYTTGAVPRNLISTALDECLANLPDLRGRFAFEFDELRLLGVRSAVGRPATTDFVGVSAERTRQLKVAARQHVLALRTQNAAVERWIGELATTLGQAVDRQGLDAALVALDLPDLSDPAGLLAVWLAGPYRPVPRHDGWWSPDPVELVEATDGLLATGGGVHTYEVLLKDLVDLGVAGGHAERWLSRQCIRIADGVVVDLRGRVADVGARVLEATGRAMSFGELCSWLPSEISVSGLVAELQRNPMFIETGPDRWELADWGGEPSVHLVRISIPVTHDVLNGNEAELSSDIASSLRLRPGVPMTFATRFGPIAVAYDGARVMRGSARPVVLASGAAVGDVVWFVIDPRDLGIEVTVDHATSNPEPSTIQSTSTAWSTT